MISESLISSLQRKFQQYARYHAARIGADSEVFEAEMWLALCDKGESARYHDKPVLEQKPAFIASWAAYRARNNYRKKSLPICSLEEELISVSAPEISQCSFVDYLQSLGEEWDVDVTKTLDCVGNEELPALAAALKNMPEQDRRIATLRLSGRNVHTLEKAGLATRYAARRVERTLIQALKAS